MLCPGMPQANEGLPSPPSRFSAEGTILHEIAEMCLLHGFEPYDFVGREMDADGFTFTVTEEMAGWLQPGLDRIYELAEGEPIYVETRVDISPWCGPGQFGTTDVAIWLPHRNTLIVWDWKFGAGVPVAPSYVATPQDTFAVEGTVFPNPQAALYALGFLNTDHIALWHIPDPEEITVRLIIEQPRAQGGGGEYELPLSHLNAFGVAIQFAAQKTYEPDAPRVPGEKQCQFCQRRKAPGGCGAYNEMMLDLLDLEFDEVDDLASMDVAPVLPDPRELTPERRAWITTHRGMIEAWLKTIHMIVLNDALKGNPTPGHKVVAGRAPARKWRKDALDIVEGVLVDALGDEGAYQPRDLITPTAAEEVLGEERYAKLVGQFVDKGRPKAVLAPASSKKPALTSADELIEDEDIGEDDG